MERESNAMPPMCRSGCGYYGNPTQDGLCSVCYKDLLRKKQQPPVSSTPSSNNAPPPSAAGQTPAAPSVNIRSVVTPQSFAASISSSGGGSSSGGNNTTTTTSASSIAATASSLPPTSSSCVATSSMNIIVTGTNTAQPTVHSGLFSSEKDMAHGKSNVLLVTSDGFSSDEENAGDEDSDYDDDDDDQEEGEVHDHFMLDIVDEKWIDSKEESDGLCIATNRHEDDFVCPAEIPRDGAASEMGLKPVSGTGSAKRPMNDCNKEAIANKRKINNDDSGSLGGNSNNSSIADNDDKDGDKDGKKKKNRCVTCRKKVGLTGFECRCGGLFCAIHRYSDKHECSFDYRELGAAEIRRNNPVVVGEKIQKI